MSKNANPGELRTKVRFVRTVRGQDEDGFYQETDQTVAEVFAKWQNVHGNEAFSDAMATLAEPATLTIRYAAALATYQPNEASGVTMLVYKSDDPRPFEIISIDDVENRHCWMEIHVKRQVPAR